MKLNNVEMGESEDIFVKLCIQSALGHYVKPIALKFKINPEISILHVVNIILCLPIFNQKILSLGLLAAI